MRLPDNEMEMGNCHFPDWDGTEPTENWSHFLKIMIETRKSFWVKIPFRHFRRKLFSTSIITFHKNMYNFFGPDIVIKIQDD